VVAPNRDHLIIVDKFHSSCNLDAVSAAIPKGIARLTQSAYDIQLGRSLQAIHQQTSYALNL